jgi:hypothetical protein
MAVSVIQCLATIDNTGLLLNCSCKEKGKFSKPGSFVSPDFVKTSALYCIFFYRTVFDTHMESSNMTHIWLFMQKIVDKGVLGVPGPRWCSGSVLATGPKVCGFKRD